MSWKKVRLPDVMFFQEGPGVRNTQFRASGIKLLNVGNINDSRINLNATKIYISEEEAYGKYKHFLVDEGDLVIASSGIVVDNFHNKIAFVEKDHLPLCMNTSTVRFKCLDKNETNINFFAYYLQTKHFKDQLRKLVTGSAQLNFGPSHLKQISFEIPPLPTQKHIASILDKADALRQQNRQLLAHYDALLQSTFIELFGDPVENPKGWEVKKLDKLIMPKSKIGYGIVQPGDHVIDGIPIVRIGDFDGMRIDTNNLKRVLPSIDKKYKNTRLQGDEILIACVGATIGKVALCNLSMKGFNIVRATAKVRSNPELLNNKFLGYYLSTEFVQNFFISETRTVSQPTLNIKQIEETPVYLPPISLQQHFAKIVEEIESQKQQAQASLAESEALFQGLLAGYFGEN